MNEESIQNQIEDGTYRGEGPDAEAYRLVFNALQAEPGFHLSESFAQRVAAQAPNQKKSFDWDKFFFIAGFVAFGIALIYALAVVKPSFSFGSFQFLNNNLLLVAFALLFILSLNWIDKKWISKSPAA